MVVSQSIREAKVYPKFKEMFMGHTSKIEFKYGDDKGLFEAMQKAYPYLKQNDIVIGEKAAEDYRKLAKGYEQFIKGLGLDVERIKEQILYLSMTTEILLDYMTEEMTKDIDRSPKSDMQLKRIEQLKKLREEIHKKQKDA